MITKEMRPFIWVHFRSFHAITGIYQGDKGDISTVGIKFVDYVSVHTVIKRYISSSFSRERTVLLTASLVCSARGERERER